MRNSNIHKYKCAQLQLLVLRNTHKCQQMGGPYFGKSVGYSFPTKRGQKSAQGSRRLAKQTKNVKSQMH